MPGRRAVAVVDVENEVGVMHPLLHSDDVGRCIDLVLASAGADRKTTDLIVGCDICLRDQVRTGTRGGRLVCGCGESGADLALIDAVGDTEYLKEFETLIVGSGDGIFVDLARQAQTVSVEVIVVARERSLSRQLRLVADRVEFITDSQAAWFTPAA